MKLIRPHGGTLINREVTGLEREMLIQASDALPKLYLNSREISDLEMIATGAFSPLEGFLCESDYLSVRSVMRRANGIAWPLPITLSVTDKEAAALHEGEDVALYQGNEHLLGILHLAEKYRYNKEREAELVYRTTDEAHPGVQALYCQGEWLLGGRISLINRQIDVSFPAYRRDPGETRSIFEQRGWRRVVAFQTRNP